MYAIPEILPCWHGLDSVRSLTLDTHDFDAWYTRIRPIHTHWKEVQHPDAQGRLSGESGQGTLGQRHTTLSPRVA
jgi:hypothetical protein